MWNSLLLSIHNIFSLCLDPFTIPMKPLRTVLAFSVKGLTYGYMMKTFMTHKYLTFGFLEDIDCISAKSVAQILPPNLQYTFLLLNSLINGLCNS